MSNHAHILLIDADPVSQKRLQLTLQQVGYTVQVAGTGQAALDLYRMSDLVLLETRLPDTDGFTVCGELRKRSYVPIVMLTALNHPEAIIHGFRMGVDDYITKPFHMHELAVRLQAILRRGAWQASAGTAQHILAAPDLLLNHTLHEVRVRGMLVSLTPNEYRLLHHLMSHPERPFSKNDLCQIIWGQVSRMDTNHVEVAIRRLRQKIEMDPAQPCYVHTVRGRGYLFRGLLHMTDLNTAS